LQRAGASVEDADRIIGTSAGSVVGALVAGGADLAERFEAQLASESSERAVPFDLEAMTEQFAAAVGQARTPQEGLARIGALAIETDTVGEDERRAIIASRLPFSGWPDRDLRITAIIADSGELVEFDRTSGVDLVDAIAASCAVPGVWPPVTIGNRRYIDGGTGSVTNADLAAGFDRIVILAPMRGLDHNPLGPSLTDALDRLRRDARVAVVEADEASVAAFGSNPLDPASRPPAARAGLRQGREAAAQVQRVWAAG
jgi:NTE family protein